MSGMAVHDMVTDVMLGGGSLYIPAYKSLGPRYDVPLCPCGVSRAVVPLGSVCVGHKRGPRCVSICTGVPQLVRMKPGLVHVWLE